MSGALCDAVPVVQTTWFATDDDMSPCLTEGEYGARGSYSSFRYLSARGAGGDRLKLPILSASTPPLEGLGGC